MPCFCAKITKFYKDLENVKKAQTYLEKISARDAGNIKRALKSLSSKAEGSVSPDNLPSLCTTIEKFNDGVASAVGNAISNCQSKANSLSGVITSLTETDKAYHKAQSLLAARLRAASTSGPTMERM